MIEMAMENAGTRLQEEITRALSEKDLLERLKRRLSLENSPDRIECFDNSHLQGSNPVAGMVVFEKGRLDPPGLLTWEEFLENGAELLGHDPQDIETIQAAYDAGLGEMDYRSQAYEEIAVS